LAGSVNGWKSYISGPQPFYSGRPSRNELPFGNQDQPHTVQQKSIGVLGISRVSIQPFLGAE
jgi:hypothetical protein